MLVETLIIQLCIGMVGPQLYACQNALEAAAIQTKIRADADLLESKTSELVVKEVTSITGEVIWVVAGTTAKAMRDKSVTYPIIRNPEGMIPSVVPTLGIDSGSLNLGWRF